MEQVPGAGVRLGVELVFAERGAGGVEHRVIRDARRDVRRAGRERPCGAEALSRALEELLRAWAHRPARTILSRSTSRMKNESIARRPVTQSSSNTCKAKPIGLTPS